MPRCERKECIDLSKVFKAEIEAGDVAQWVKAPKFGGVCSSTTIVYHVAPTPPPPAAQHRTPQAAGNNSSADARKQIKPKSSNSKKKDKKKPTVQPSAKPSTQPDYPKPKEAVKKQSTAAKAPRQGAAAEQERAPANTSQRAQPDPPKSKKKHVKLGGSNEGAFGDWIRGCPSARPGLQQPSLKDNEARWEIGSHVETGTLPVKRTLRATLVMPSLSGGKDHRFGSTGSDVGEEGSSFGSAR